MAVPLENESDSSASNPLVLIRRSRGAVALYVAMMPVVFGLLSVAIDLSAAASVRDSMQRETDRIALSAAQLLPDTERASQFLLDSTANLQSAYTNLSLVVAGSGLAATAGSLLEAELRSKPSMVHDSAIKVSLRAVYRPAFFPESFAVPILTTATSEVVPSDTVLVINDGRTLRPEPGFPLPEANEISWPASKYFNCTLAPHAGRFPGIPDFADSNFRRSATQTCFNPNWSALKLAAVSVSDELRARSLDRVGALFTPGDPNTDRGFSVLRHVQGEVTYNSVTYLPGLVGGFPDQAKPEVAWSDVYQDAQTGIGDELCVLFGAHGFGEEPYTLPAVLRPYSRRATATREIIATSPCGQQHHPFGRLNLDYMTQDLTLREAIYYHAARSPSPLSSAIPNFDVAIKQSVVELVGTGVPFEYERAVRGNLAAAALRRIVIFTDRIDSALEAAIGSNQSALCSSRIDLNVVAISGSSTETSSCPGRSRLRFFVPTAGDRDDIRNWIVGTVLHSGRQIALRS